MFYRRILVNFLEKQEQLSTFTSSGSSAKSKPRCSLSSRVIMRSSSKESGMSCLASQAYQQQLLCSKNSVINAITHRRGTVSSMETPYDALMPGKSWAPRHMQLM
eukprot:3090390-Amphidinium_carterae.1